MSRQEADSAILQSLQDGVLTLIFNRPDKKNALDRGMYRQLIAALGAADRDEAVRVVLLRGAGGSFTAGNDLADFRGGVTELPEPFDLMRALVAFEKPIVAAVEGLAVGIGTTLLPHCDLVYAGESARFKTPFVDLAVTPEAASSLLLPVQLGMPRAAALLMLGELISARQAEAWGLLTALVPDAEVVATAEAAAARLAAKSPEALRLTKRLMRKGLAERVRALIDEEEALFVSRLRSQEAQAILAAFFRR